MKSAREMEIVIIGGFKNEVQQSEVTLDQLHLFAHALSNLRRVHELAIQAVFLPNQSDQTE
jgi:hypothetical protein